METKVYYDRDLSVIMEQVKQELGPDAIIIKSRHTKKKGILGLFQKPVYEVVVSYDPEDVKKNALFGARPVLHEKSPLSDFGKDTERRLQQAMPKKPVKITEEKKNERPRESLFDTGETGEDSYETEDFAKLIQMAGEQDEPPAWVTPDAKLGAYRTMGKKEEADVPAVPLEQLLPKEEFASLSPSERRAKEILEALEQRKRNAEEDNLGSAHRNFGESAAGTPKKRKRGRPRKNPLPDEAEENAVALSETEQPARKEGAQLVSRLDVVEQMLQNLMSEMQKPQKPEEQKILLEEENLEEAERREISRYKEMLLRQDVDFPVVDALLAIAVTYKRHKGLDMNAAVVRALNEVLGRPRYLRGSTKTARTVMMVGPTGVGKTTTLVKLAAGCMFERKAKVAIINADVFRVGAQDQLNAYAKILDVPLKTIYAAKELEKAIEEFEDQDFVFIDTCGKASNDKD